MAEKKKKVSLRKEYKQTNFGTQGDKSWSEYKATNKQEIANRKQKLDAKVDVNRGKVNDTSSYKGRVAPDYTPKSTYVKPNEDMSNRATTYTNKYPDYNSTPVDKTTSSSSTESTKSESPTGNLSPKSETTANDRMSWAREAEKKARKLMGGN